MAVRGFHQVLTGLSYGDAITHHALALRQALLDRGIPSSLFAEQIADRFLDLARPLSSLETESRPDDVILFHHSIHSSAAEAVLAHRGPLLLVYHNVTPPHFFYPYDVRYASLLDRGRRELDRLAERTVLAFADSEFNRRDLVEAGFRSTCVMPIIVSPPLYRVAANRVVHRIFNDNYINILSVGRIVPQKRLDHLIRMFALFRRYLNNKSRLILVGPYRGFERHSADLLDLIERLRLGEVYFTGLLPFRELLACYRSAHVFVSASEHEGFCVPLIEALMCDVPVVARNACAVPETVGQAGILYSTRDPLELAELINHVIGNQELRERLRQNSGHVLARHASSTSLDIFFSQCQQAGVL